MESKKKVFSDREEGESCAELLEELEEQLCSSKASVRRQAAFSLSWMQENGLEILKATVFGDHSESTKNAAAYGLRKMRGRMKKLALDVFKEGLKQGSSSTVDVCSHALDVMGESDGKPPKIKKKKKKKVKHKIQDIPRSGNVRDGNVRDRVVLHRPHPNRR